MPTLPPLEAWKSDFCLDTLDTQLSSPLLGTDWYILLRVQMFTHESGQYDVRVK